MGMAYTDCLMATAPICCNRRHIFTRKAFGLGGIWCINSNHLFGFKDDITYSLFNCYNKYVTIVIFCQGGKSGKDNKILYCKIWAETVDCYKTELKLPISDFPLRLLFLKKIFNKFYVGMNDKSCHLIIIISPSNFFLNRRG